MVIFDCCHQLRGGHAERSSNSDKYIQGRAFQISFKLAEVHAADSNLRRDLFLRLTCRFA